MTVHKVVPRRAESSGAQGDRMASRMIDLDEYINLAISTRKLVRCYERCADIHWLMDSTTGERFGIEDAKLASCCVPHAVNA